MSEIKAGNIQVRELHDVVILIGERGLTSSVVTTSEDLKVTMVRPHHEQTLRRMHGIHTAACST